MNMRKSSLAVALLTMLTATTSLAQDQPILTLSNELLKRQIDQSLTSLELPDQGKITGGVILKQIDVNHYHLKVPFEAKKGVWVAFKAWIDLELICRDGVLRISSTGVQDIESANFAGWMALWVAQLVPYVTEKVDASINGELFPAVNLGNVCPGIEIQPNAWLRLDYNPGNQCTGNETRVEPCPPWMTGSGVRKKCSNGRWESNYDYCEVVPPDGPPL